MLSGGKNHLKVLFILRMKLTNFLLLFLNFFHIMPTHAARRQEIIKMTEQLIEAINNGDFDAYT